MPNNTNTTVTIATPNPFPAAPPEGHSLTDLRADLGDPDETTRHLLFRTTREDALVEQGVKVDSRGILDDVPRFVASALRIVGKLDPERRALVKLPPPIFAVLVDEAVTLDKLKAEHDAATVTGAGNKAGIEATLRRLMREGTALRDRVTGAIENALGDDEMHEVDAIVGDATTPEALAGGLDAIAGFLGDRLANGSTEDQAALSMWELNEASTDELQDKASAIREAAKPLTNHGRRVSQRALDLQDGRVLHLMEQVLRAFRRARRADGSILLPELGKIAWMFESRSGARTPKPAPEPPK